MNKQQTDHLKRIIDQFNEEITAKYQAGAKEHASVLSEDYSVLQVMDMAIEEAIDQVTYLYTLREMLRDARA